MGAVFFLSGFSSLIYEVVWMRRLALFFGSDVYSAALTLSAFMGGLSLGGLIAARYADRLRRTLFWYGLLEICIGLYALFFPGFLNLFSHQYQSIYRAYFDTAPWRYHGFRILVATVTLIVPTTMMGATLPLVVKYFARNGAIGRQSGLFYSMNTCGALTGVLAVGFIFLPTLGVNATTILACGVNILIGVAAIVFSWLPSGDAPLEIHEEERPGNGTTGPCTVPQRGATRAALIAISFSGLAALALEVIWMRILEQSFSATVFSFSIMLSCFLFGLFFGSNRISSLVDRRQSLLRLFGFLELGLGLHVAFLGILVYFVPLCFSTLLWLLTGVSGGKFGLASTVAQLVVSAFLILVPTILMGAAFPVAVRICTPALASIGRGIGSVYAANTAGGIIGALLGGMVLIPAVGTRMSLLAIAAVFTIAGIVLLYQHAGAGWTSLRDPGTAAVLMFSLLSAGIVLLLPRQVVTNFYYAGREKAQVIYHGEGIAHNVDIIKTSKGITIMQVNGTLEADTTYAQRRHFILKAALPLLLHADPQNVAVIGLGLGITLGAIDRYPNVRNIEVIELTREMVDAQRYLENVSGGVLRSLKIHLRIDDGRNFMAMTDRQFDMITADPIHPRVTGVGYLYTKEYYESIKRCLRPRGVVCQWMPMYRISRTSFDVAFRTFVSVFPNASFWYVRGHGLFVATQEPFLIDFNALAGRIRDPAVRQDLDSIKIHDAPQLLAHVMMGPEQIAQYLASAPGRILNTDDDAYLEYHTPFELLESTKTIVKALTAYSALPIRNIRNVENLSAKDKEELTQAWHDRQAELMPEFDIDMD
jgi:spermidine synthase